MAVGVLAARPVVQVGVIILSGVVVVGLLMLLLSAFHTVLIINKRPVWFISQYHSINGPPLMAHSRPSKRQRVGGAYHDPVPFVDDFSMLHAREGKLVHVGRELLTAPAERSPQHEADRTWDTASSWLPVDDPQFALDPDGEWYDEVMNGEVMDDPVPTDGPTSSTQPKKRVRSKLSVGLALIPIKMHLTYP